MFEQGQRLERELKETRLAHALRMANQRLYYLQTRRILGTEFSQLEIETTMHDQLRMEGVAPEFIPAVVGLIVERYIPKVAVRKDYGFA